MALLALLPLALAALQGQAAPPTAGPAATVEGVITGVNGMVVDLLGGAGGLSIDLSHARIVYAGAEANDIAVPPITVGSELMATVEVPTVQGGGTPPPLVATFAVLRLPKMASLRGGIDSVDVPGGTFTVLSRIIHVDNRTVFSGGNAQGPVRGLADLQPGMDADVTLTVGLANVSTPVLLAERVVAHGGAIPPQTMDFRGVVHATGPQSWTIGDMTVQVTAQTKIVGDPKVGDTVEVVVQFIDPPNPMMGMPSRIVALSITKVVLPPPPVAGRATSFTGVVQEMPPSGRVGVWRIADRRVTVNGLTTIEGKPGVGSLVQVTGYLLPNPMGGPAAMSPAAMPFVATSIKTVP